MKIYKICICRNVQYTAAVYVEAKDKEQANRIARDKYYNGDYDDELEPIDEYFDIVHIEEDK